jgi:WD40 repeat protein
MKQAKLFSFFKSTKESAPYVHRSSGKQLDLISISSPKKNITATEVIDESATIIVGKPSSTSPRAEAGHVTASQGDQTGAYTEDKDVNLDYEERRIKNLQRNAEFLHMLGLGDLKSLMAPALDPSSAGAAVHPRRKRTRDSSESSRGIMPTRRSTRNMMKESINYNISAISEVDAYRDDEVDEIQEDVVEDAALYDDSSVLRYVLTEQNTDILSTSNISKSNAVLGPASGTLRISDESLAFDCEDLAAVYSVHTHPVHPSLLMAAGKGGQVVVYKVPSSNAASDNQNVLMSFKAHSKWIGSARFIGPLNQADMSIFAVTTADDGLVKVWDLNASKNATYVGGTIKQETSTPRMLLSSNMIHDKGVYAMDICGQTLLTGSKDKSICISNCIIISKEGDKASKASLEIVSKFTHHAAIIKSVAWQASGKTEVFASGGQDNRVCIKDLRSPPSLADVQISGLYGSGGVHTVKWSPDPEEPFLLLTAGFGDALKLFDIRRPDALSPLFELRGHCFNAKSVASGVILSPTFLPRHRCIATAGYGNSLISIYSTATGKCVSRGELPENPKSVYFGGNDEIFISCHRNGTIYRRNLIA